MCSREVVSFRLNLIQLSQINKQANKKDRYSHTKQPQRELEQDNITVHLLLHTKYSRQLNYPIRVNGGEEFHERGRQPSSSSISIGYNTINSRMMTYYDR